MFRSISEPDWKLFRRLQPIALDRFCRCVLAEVERIASDADMTSHERYLAVFQRIKQRERELADAFDDQRRSTAIQQLAGIETHALLIEEEMAGFSAEMREAVRFLLE